MATQTVVLATANSDAVRIEIDYNDVSLLITTARLVNNGTIGKMTVTLIDKDTAQVIFGPTTRGFGTGTFTQNVSGAGLLMEVSPPSPKGGGPGIMVPFNTSLEWASV